MYEQVVPEFAQCPWDLSVEDLREIILSFDEDHPQKQDFLEQLNRSVAQLTLQPIAPSEQTTYLVWFVTLIVFNQKNILFFLLSVMIFSINLSIHSSMK